MMAKITGDFRAAEALPPGAVDEGIASSKPETDALAEFAEPTIMPEEGEAFVPGKDPDLWIYRDRTIALLRRYMRLAVEMGRLPSLLGREFFRTRVTSYHTQTFEDAVIFVHDVESCLDQLNGAERILIAMIVLQDRPHEETGRMLDCTRRTIVRRYWEAIDRISEIFLERDILTPVPEQEPTSPEACQEDKMYEIPVSDSEDAKYIFRNYVSPPPGDLLF